MDIIKVRMWNGTGNRFHFGRMAMECLNQQNCGEYDHVGRGGAVFELFTGRTDINGVEIFAGDILKGGKVVKWFDDLTYDSGGALHPGFYFTNNNYPDEDGELSYHFGFDDDIEVIGNIHQHSHLLKGE